MAAVEEFTPLNQIRKGVDSYNVKVKVHFVWKKFWLNNPTSVASIEMVLVDQQGNKIRACIEKDTVRYFEQTFIDGRFLIMGGFVVVDENDHTKFIDNRFKLLILKNSIVKKAPEFLIERDVFRFATYDQVNNRVLKTDEVFDVVGRVVNVLNFRTIRDKNCVRKKLEFQLLFHSGEIIRCALWGDHGIRLLDVAKKHQISGSPVIALIHNCLLKNWDGTPEVNNIFFGTRLYLNESVPPIDQFNQMLSSSPRLAEFTLIPTMSPDFSDAEEITSNKFTATHPVFVSAIFKLPKDVYFVLLGNVVKLFGSDEKQVLWCDVCKSDDQKWNPRIRTTMTIKDQTDECQLILFDSQLSKIVNRSSTWLNATAQACVDPFDVPHVLNEVLNKSFVFLAKKTHFNVQNNYNAYTVLDATDELVVLDEVQKKLSAMGLPLEVINVEAEYETPKQSKTEGTFRNTNDFSSSSQSNGGDTSDGKRKMFETPDGNDEDTPTGGTSAGIGALKIPKMESL
ncbi:uncharacterized protein [Rutidosis leptorrhynchoides]|uniref:uncharacterized protein n=1 Tax=Rutidosis leptorrhynchoides TaxID=125765 RepID=UPI003A995766